MALAAGDKLGPYAVLAKIGAGGMGEVYRASDTRLNRDVAIKISASQFSERFEREAQAISALNHPNICHLYDVGPNYLVMELVEGETLADRIKQGPIARDEALLIARQIADALEAAHEKGIVHRDLKPGNVKITPDGTVKVLDFGLAKTGSTPASTSENSPTLTMAQTEAGVILGTASYMAPEQAKGKPVDKRADIYAFGAVLYEMLAGKRLHQGETTTEVLSSVIKEEPDWQSVPLKFRLLLQRCLEKDPRKRLRDIGDAMALVDLAPAAGERVGSGRSILPWVAAAGIFFVIAAAAIPFAFAHLREKRPAAAEVRFEVPPPSKGNFDVYMTLSPDGRRLAYTATGEDGALRIWVRDLDSIESRPVEGTENAQSLFWSPDSRFIAFGSGNQLKKVDVSGGPPVTLCDSPSPVGSGGWSTEGVIVFGGKGSGVLQKVAEAGGVPSPITELDKTHGDTFHSFPFFLPDGRHFVYFRNSAAQYEGIYVGSVDAKPAEQSSKLRLATRFDAVYEPSLSSRVGNLLFLRDGTLMVQPFDTGKLEVTGEPVPVAEHVGGTNVYGNFSVSFNGTLAFRTGAGEGGSDVVWMDRSGKRLETVAKPGAIAYETLSPDGKTIAFVKAGNQEGSDIWLHDIARGTDTRFTFGPGNVTTPVWSPDSSHILYGARSSSGYDLYEKAASGAAKEQMVLRVGANLRVSDWSHDGKTVAYVPKAGSPDLWLLPMEGDHKPTAYLQTKFAEFNGQFSPDGHWMAYASDESGQVQVYVQPVPTTGAKWQISTTGGNRPRWRRDGKELFYIAADQNLMAVPIKASSTFEVGIPQSLFRTPITANQAFQFFYTPSPDGQKILMQVPAGAEGPSQITVVLNWQASLKR